MAFVPTPKASAERRGTGGGWGTGWWVVGGEGKRDGWWWWGADKLRFLLHFSQPEFSGV